MIKLSYQSESELKLPLLFINSFGLIDFFSIDFSFFPDYLEIDFLGDLLLERIISFFSIE
jgi:hypothetical protein